MVIEALDSCNTKKGGFYIIEAQSHCSIEILSSTLKIFSCILGKKIFSYNINCEKEFKKKTYRTKKEKEIKKAKD